MVRHHEFYKEVNNVDPTPYMNHLNNGVFYGYKRDISMRPVIILNIRRMIDTKMETEPLQKMGDFSLSHLLNNAIAPGRVENWTVIFDLNDVGITEIPKEQLQGIVSNMTSNYRGRLYKMFVVNANMFVRGLWYLA